MTSPAGETHIPRINIKPSLVPSSRLPKGCLPGTGFLGTDPPFRPSSCCCVESKKSLKQQFPLLLTELDLGREHQPSHPGPELGPHFLPDVFILAADSKWSCLLQRGLSQLWKVTLRACKGPHH